MGLAQRGRQAMFGGLAAFIDPGANMSRYACLSAALLFALAGCESYGADDFAADVACGAREEACLDQCAAVYRAGGDAERYLECQDRCRPSDQTVCR